MVKVDPHRMPHKSTATVGSPVADKAHIVNKDAHDQRVQQGPGSLDPATLEPPSIPDVRRWLAKRGFELSIPANWRFLGMPFDGRGIAFNHNGSADSHALEVTTWRLADDTPLDKFLQPYVEEADELVRLGRLVSHRPLTIGDAEGILFVGWGPDDKDALAKANAEQLYLATDGTGRRTLSWRGAVKRQDERQLVIVSMSSPIETFFEARPVFDAMFDRMRVVAL